QWANAAIERPGSHQAAQRRIGLVELTLARIEIQLPIQSIGRQFDDAAAAVFEHLPKSGAIVRARQPTFHADDRQRHVFQFVTSHDYRSPPKRKMRAPLTPTIASVRAVATGCSRHPVFLATSKWHRGLNGPTAHLSHPWATSTRFRRTFRA